MSRPMRSASSAMREIFSPVLFARSLIAVSTSGERVKPIMGRTRRGRGFSGVRGIFVMFSTTSPARVKLSAVDPVFQIIGVDTGSAHQGVTVLLRTPGGPFPFALIDRARIPVDPANLAHAAAATWTIIEAHPEARVVIEEGSPYGRGGMVNSKIAANLYIAGKVGDRVMVLCQGAGIRAQCVVAQSWRWRVVPPELRGMKPDKLGRPRPFIRDTHVRAALLLYLSPEDVARLGSRDERDAAGAAIGVTLLEEDAAAKVTVARSVRHERGPASPRVRGSGKRSPPKPRSLAERMAASRARTAAKGDAPHKVAPCKRCGGPRTGHLRGLPCPLP